MDDCYLSTVNPDTVTDFLSINMTQDMLDSINRRINSGDLKHNQMYIFGCGKKVEAAFIVSAAPIVVLRISFGISEIDIGIFAAMLRDILKDDKKIVIIDTHLSAVNIDAFTNAGWKLKGHDKLYQTDLTNGEWKLDSEVTEMEPAALLSADMLDFYKKILEKDESIGDTGSSNPLEAFEDDVSDDNVRLFVLKDQNTVTSAATLTSSIPGEASVSGKVGIHLLGVVPSERGKGIGGRLHAHLLAVAKASATLHVGGTSADNFAMHKIYERNGAEMVSEQFQLVL